MNDAAVNAPDTLQLVPHDPKHNLFQRLNAVMREARYVMKDKEVDGKYPVATYDAVLEVVRDSFINHGIVVETRLVEGHSTETGGVTSKGAKWMRYSGIYEIRFVNIDNPSDVTNIPVSAEADDMGDKGAGKAQTYATKAAIKKQLLIRTGDEEEARVGASYVDKETGEITPERPRPTAKAEGGAKVVPMKPGKVASQGEIAFTKAKLKTDDNIAAFCAQLGIASIEQLPEGGGKLVNRFLAAEPA